MCVLWVGVRLCARGPSSCRFKFNNINLDALTETYNVSFYYHYLSTFPDYFKAEEHPNGRLMGYIMGKAEGEGELWHG